MTLHYGPTTGAYGPTNVASTFEFESDADWHVTAAGDTGTSFIANGRLYIVQCQWCTEAFAGATKAEAVTMFRDHENAMAEQAMRESHDSQSGGDRG